MSKSTCRTDSDFQDNVYGCQKFFVDSDNLREKEQEIQFRCNIGDCEKVLTKKSSLAIHKQRNQVGEKR